MKPTLGRIVMVMWQDGVVSPAIVTRTKKDTNYSIEEQQHIFERVPIDRWGNRPMTEDIMKYIDVDVQVFGLVGVYPLYGVPFSEVPRCGHWYWPERGA